jgi:hypothetical protein
MIAACPIAPARRQLIEVGPEIDCIPREPLAIAGLATVQSMANG